MRRLDPWPVVADLFAGLLIATFAALVLFSVFSSRHLQEQEVRTRIDQRREQVANVLAKNLGTQATKCDVEDVCVSVQIEYDVNSNKINDSYERQLQKACQGLRQAFQSWTPAERNEIFIQIEGNTDKQRPSGKMSDRQRQLYNWNLSASRAISVLHEFNRCGLPRQGIKMIAVGLADTKPLCREDTEDCYQRNRRTTFRIKPDHNAIKKDRYRP